jgi:hypothetical protein
VKSVVFVIRGHRDERQAVWALYRLRKSYPDSRVVLISDGDDRPVWNFLANRYNLEYVAGECLYPIENNGKLCQRTFEVFLKDPADYLLKIDTDTWVWEPLTYWPSHRGLFGTVQQSHTLISIQGGCIGFTRETVEELYASKVMLDDRISKNQELWRPKIPKQFQNKVYSKKNMVIEDWLFGWAAKELDMPCYGHPEIKSMWNEIPIGWKITHPHKYPKPFG